MNPARSAGTTGSATCGTVVGVVRPIAFNLEEDPRLDVFLPATQASWTSGIVFVQGTIPAPSLARTIASTVSSLDRTIPAAELTRGSSGRLPRRRFDV